MNSRLELESRYPLADFSAYFLFLDACRGTECGRDTHEHHICPRAQFPEFIDTAENKIVLRVADHTKAHELLHKAEPSLWAPSKWVALASQGGLIGGRSGGLISGFKSVENGRLSKYRTSEHQTKAGRSSSHVRWHVKRNIVSSACALCTL